MKQELLRISRGKSGEEIRFPVRDLYLQVLSGELDVLLCENWDTKDTICRFLAGQEGLSDGVVILNGENLSLLPERPITLPQRHIITLEPEHMLTETLSISENLYLEEKDVFRNARNDQELRQRAEQLLRRFDVHVDASAPAGTLSALARIQVELLRWYRTGIRVVVVDEPGRLLKEAEFSRIFRLINALCGEGMAFLLVTTTRWLIRRFHNEFDVITVVEDGRTTRVFRGAGTDTERFFAAHPAAGDADRLLSSGSDAGRLPSAAEGTGAVLPAAEGTGAVLAVAENSGVRSRGTDRRKADCFACSLQFGASHEPVRLQLEQGGLYQAVFESRRRMLEFRQILTGESRGWIGYMRLQGEDYRPESPQQAVDARVCWMDPNDLRGQLFENMSIYDNIVLARGWNFWGLKSGSKYRDHIRSVLETEFHTKIDLDTRLGEVTASIQEIVLYQKWYLMSPRILLIEKPFAFVNAEMRGIAVSMIRRFLEKQTTVILLTGQEDPLPELPWRGIYL